MIAPIFRFANLQKQDHLRMNVALDQTIISGRQIFFDHRSLSLIGQMILMILSPTPPLFRPKLFIGGLLDVLPITVLPITHIEKRGGARSPLTFHQIFKNAEGKMWRCMNSIGKET